MKIRTMQFIFVLALFLLTSCAPGLSVKTVDPTETVEQSEKEALVFGKIIFIENGEEKGPYTLAVGSTLGAFIGYGIRKPDLTLLHKESGKRKWHLSVETDGSFYWIVPRGSYTISEIGYNHCDYLINPQMTFSVPTEGSAFYLGTLKIDVEIKKFLLGIWIKKINSMEIIDEFDVAKGLLVSSSGIEKSLITRISQISPSMKSNYCCHAPCW